MTDASAGPNPPALPTQTVSFSGRYLAMVGGLLILIIAMLAVLWVRERSRRVEAETTAAELKKENAKLQFILGMTFKGGAAPSTAPAEEGPSSPPIQPFQRQDQVPVTVTLDGAKRAAFRLSAEGAARFGFREGDVILVMPRAAPTSAPETTGSGR